LVKGDVNVRETRIGGDDQRNKTVPTLASVIYDKGTCHRLGKRHTAGLEIRSAKTQTREGCQSGLPKRFPEIMVGSVVMECGCSKRSHGMLLEKLTSKEVSLAGTGGSVVEVEADRCPRHTETLLDPTLPVLGHEVGPLSNRASVNIAQVEGRGMNHKVCSQTTSGATISRRRNIIDEATHDGNLREDRGKHPGPRSEEAKGP
jgi:hypothetical protein